MSIKLNTGWCRGLALKSVQGSHTRPTSSRVREAVWNAILSRVEVHSIIDLFAGSGAVGLEGLSRGGQRAVFIESRRQAFGHLKENIKALQYRAKSQDIEVSVQAFEARVESQWGRLSGEKFDLVWMDPPYTDLLVFLQANIRQVIDLSSSSGIIVCESSSCDLAQIEMIFCRFDSSLKIEQKQYASTGITLVTKRSERHG